MDPDESLRLPTQWSDRRRWETFRACRTVLAVARTYTSTVRLLDALSVFRSDERVHVLFAFDPTSAFGDGVPELLAEAGVRLVPWDGVPALDCDLVLTASENVDLDQLDAPVVVLPHGIGFHKNVPDSRGAGDRVSGVVPERYLRGKRVWMAVSHPGQREQLRPGRPDAADRCVVIGDAVHDRMVASLPLREHYRRALGVGRRQRLVVLTSTWRDDSLLGAWPRLPALLLEELPYDEYRVAVVTHPNIRSWHGDFHTGQVMADARAMGLLRIPPSGGWQAALVAADAVVGDHGSVTLYGAALDRPVLLASSSTTTIADTPPQRLARVAPRLDPGRSLREQVAHAIDTHPPGRYGDLAARMFARRGEAVRALRDLLYERLELDVPSAHVPVPAVADPRAEADPPRAFTVHSRVAAPGVLDVWRHPTRGRGDTRRAGGLYTHLSCYEDEPDRLLVDNATVVVRARVTGREEAGEWALAALSHYPAAFMAVAAGDRECHALLRDGRRLTASGDGDASSVAAALYTCVRAGVGGRVTVRAGGLGTELHVC
ncbi:hypothetical protein [Nonomuraea longicatena]|uniref:hypothetical protein n=1 Tax=Nonomuraea longicatena TaxID=83682 RepID=UPI0031D43584